MIFVMIGVLIYQKNIFNLMATKFEMTFLRIVKFDKIQFLNIYPTS